MNKAVSSGRSLPEGVIRMKQADDLGISLILGSCFGTLIARTLLCEVAMKKVISAVKWGMDNPLVVIYYFLPFLVFWY